MDRSFTEYISKRFDDAFWEVIGKYITENCESLDLHSYSVKHIDEAELSNVTVKQIGVDDREGMKVAFDVIVEAEIDIIERDRHNDNSDTCSQWFMLSCIGDLSCHLDDFAITSVELYNQKSKHNKPLSDSLVPYIYAVDLEKTATQFLKKNYPEALLKPMVLDTLYLANKLGLKIEQYQITKDFSVFGQIFFSDCETEVYDKNADAVVTKRINAKTIVVDPQAFLLRNLGSVNNTIIHECVHWDLHRKAFELEKLYNTNATQIKCEVVGGIRDEKVRTATDWMEWQANSLAPRIQMPLEQFKIKANEFIRQYRRELGNVSTVDLMPVVIDALAAFFVVSRCAAKIRMVDAGFDEAIGAFTFIDGKYVKPFAFKKGSLEKNQTFSVSREDALFEGVFNLDLRDEILCGAYVYFDSHVCLNQPQYVTKADDGEYFMTEYARLHTDECCIAFTLEAKGTNKYGAEFYKQCVLFRDANPDIRFEAHFAKDKNGAVVDKAKAVKSYSDDVKSVMSKLPQTFQESFEMLFAWSGLTVEKLSENSLLSDRTIRRIRNEPNYSLKIETVVALCIAMQLPPPFSRHLIQTAGFSFRYNNEAHIIYEAFISGFYTQTIYECNNILREQNLPELTGKE